MKVHLVYEEDYLEPLKEMLAEAGHTVTGWDYSLPLFAAFSEKKTIDADLALIDGQAGVTEKKEVIEALGMVRKNLPGLRLIVIFPTALDKDEKLKEKLLSYSIYDIYFVDEYDMAALGYWFNNPKTYGNYDIKTDDLAGPLPPRDSVVLQPRQEERQERGRFVIDSLKKMNIKEKLALKRKPEKKRASGLSGTTIPDFFESSGDRKAHVADGTASAKKKPVLYSWGVEHDGITAFKEFRQLCALAEMVRPDAILLSGCQEENIEHKVREIKRNKNLWDLPVVVIGKSGPELYRAGADYCLLEWNDGSLDDILPRLGKLQSIRDLSRNEALKDPLTGAYNRMFMEELLDKAILDYNMRGVPFCGLFCDLDRFKNLNDTYGHQAGDEVLKAFVAFLNENTRSGSGDFVVRYGGEEFLMIFGAVAAGAVAGKVDNMRLAWQEKDRYGSTFSGALADYRGEGKERFLRKLDEALYMAKNAGRNRVIYIQEEDGAADLQAGWAHVLGGGFQTSVYAVAGAAPRVGATSFALMLAKELSSKYPVEILDAGGGAYDWLGGRGDRNIRVRKCPPYSITPGVVTLIDAGTEVHDDLKPFVEATFIVTDVSKKAVFIKNLAKGPAYLVGNRCVGDIHRLSEVWKLPVILKIGHEEKIRDAEARGIIPEIKSVSKTLKTYI